MQTQRQENQMERTIKTVCIAVGTVKNYSRYVWRVVECRKDQQGYRSEKGVKVHYESAPLYRPHAKRSSSQGFKARQTAAQVAEITLRNTLGV